MDHVDDQRTIEEIRETTHSTEFQVSKLLFDQYQAGHVKLVKLRSGGGDGTGAATLPRSPGRLDARFFGSAAMRSP